MHDIWNPWHGCRKYSEGCDHCYMYYLDSLRDVNSTLITKTNNFNYPLQKKRDGSFKVQAGELIRVCMTSDSVSKRCKVLYSHKTRRKNQRAFTFRLGRWL